MANQKCVVIDLFYSLSQNSDECIRTQNTEKLMNLMQEDNNRQTLLSQQQADSVRYLNELNTVRHVF